LRELLYFAPKKFFNIIIKNMEEVIDMAVRPISPTEAMDQKFIPDEVIKAFNELIMENITHDCVAIIKRDDIIERTINIIQKRICGLYNESRYCFR
jgi:hypothetical protein